MSQQCNTTPTTIKLLLHLPPTHSSIVIITMDSDSFTSLAWPEPAEVTPTETDALLPPECQLASPIDYKAYFGSNAFEPTALPARPPPKVPEIVLPGTASWSIDDGVRPIMPVASWVRVADYRRGDETLELKQDGGVRPKDTLIQAIEESPEPTSFFATYAAEEDNCKTVELHEQDLTRKSTEPATEEDEAMIPVVPKMATRKSARIEPTGGVLKPANTNASVSAKAGKRRDGPVDLEKRTCESCGKVFRNRHAKK